MVKSVFTEITSSCEVLKQVAQDCYQVEQSFMYTQILKEISLTIDIEQKTFYGIYYRLAKTIRK